ncbi:MAG: hypothetical protein ACTHPD_12290, partial [Rhizomicrobium sp.]
MARSLSISDQSVFDLFSITPTVVIARLVRATQFPFQKKWVARTSRAMTAGGIRTPSVSCAKENGAPDF